MCTSDAITGVNWHNPLFLIDFSIFVFTRIWFFHEKFQIQSESTLYNHFKRGPFIVWIHILKYVSIYTKKFIFSWKANMILGYFHVNIIYKQRLFIVNSFFWRSLVENKIYINAKLIEIITRVTPKTETEIIQWHICFTMNSSFKEPMSEILCTVVNREKL